MNENIEETTYTTFMDSLREGNDQAALQALSNKFPDGADYAGDDLFVYLTDNYNPVTVLFLAIHYGCQATFEDLKQKMLKSAEENEDTPYIGEHGIYYVMLDELSNLGDPELADKIAKGMVPDLWPVTDEPSCFGIPCRAEEVEANFNALNYNEVRNFTVLKENTLEALVPLELAANGTTDLNQGRERLTPEEFGDRSRDHSNMTVVFNLEE